MATSSSSSSSQGSAPGVLGQRKQTPGDLIIDSLEDLNRSDFKRFRNKLSDFSYEDKRPIPRGKLENADCITTKDILIGRYGEEGALDVTITVFTEIGLMGPADDLRKRRAQHAAELPLSKQETKAEPPSQKTINGITLCSKEEYERIRTEERNGIYPMRPRNGRTRLALIICNDTFQDCTLKERKGAEHDVNGMEELLKGLGYEVVKKTNLTVQEMRDTMKEFAADKKHETSDSTFLVFMSHGENNVICGTDSQHSIAGAQDSQHSIAGETTVLHVGEIFSTFNNINCRGLLNKPKIIIIQACRGNECGGQWVTDSTCAPPVKYDAMEDDAMEDDAMRGKKVLKESDFICFYSSTPDTISRRDTIRGCDFIISLIEHIKRDAHRLPIQDIFLNVMASFKKDNVQMPTVERATLDKKLYLFPGI